MESVVAWYDGLLNNKELMHGILTWLGTIFPIYVFVVTSKFTFESIIEVIIKNKWLLLKVFLIVSIATPLITSGIIAIFNVPLVLAGIMLIASIAVGDPFDLVDAHGKKGSLLMASAIMIILVILMPLTVPVWMWVFSQWFPLHLSATPLNVFTHVSIVVLVPAFLGLLFRQYLPKVTDILEKVLKQYFVISALLITLFFISGSIGKIIFVFGLAGIIAMFLMISITLIMGYYVAKGLERKERISISLACSLGNMAAVLFIARLAYPELDKSFDFLVTVFGWVVLRWLIIYCWFFFMKYRVKKEGETLEEDKI